MSDCCVFLFFRRKLSFACHNFSSWFNLISDVGAQGSNMVVEDGHHKSFLQINFASFYQP
jgi:hypothetical protein